MPTTNPGPAPYTVHRGTTVDSVYEQYSPAEARAVQLAGEYADVFITNGMNARVWP